MNYRFDEKAKAFLECVSRPDKKINFHLALLTQLCEREVSTFETHHKDLLMTDLYINGEHIHKTPTNMGLGLSLRPGTYTFKIKVKFDYDMDLSIISRTTYDVSELPDKRFQKDIVKELTVTVDNANDCYVAFNAFLSLEWDSEQRIDTGDYYNWSKFEIKNIRRIVSIQDGYEFSKTSKTTLDRLCCYWQNPEYKHTYPTVDREFLGFFRSKYGSSSTTYTAQKTTTKSTYTFDDEDEDYTPIFDIEKELSLQTNAKISQPKQTSSYTSTPKPTSTPSVQKDYVAEINQDAVNRIKDQSIKNGNISSFLYNHALINAIYDQQKDKLLDSMKKELFFKAKVRYEDYLDGSKYIGYKDKGTYFSINGEVYEGDFKNGEKTGKGRLIYPDGKILKGEFQNGKLIKGETLFEEKRYE